MKIYVKSYNKPSADTRSIENDEIYSLMEEKKIDRFSFGILMHINDYNWHHGDGNGSLINVYDSYEEALEHHKIYPRHPDDEADECYSDRAIEIIVSKNAEKNRIQIDVEVKDEPIFDVYTISQLNNMIPFAKSKTK